MYKQLSYRKAHFSSFQLCLVRKYPNFKRRPGEATLIIFRDIKTHTEKFHEIHELILQKEKKSR